MNTEPVRIFRYPFVFPPEAEDENRHVNNVEYVRMLQESAIAHTRQNGWAPEELHERGWTWVVRSHFIEYLQPCRAAPNGSEAADFCTRADLYRTLGFALSIGGAAVSTAGAVVAALAAPTYERVVSHPQTSRVTVSPLAHPDAQGAIVTWTF